MNTYGDAVCGICGKKIKRNGFAMISHVRSHVKDGDLIEMPFSSPPQFKKDNEADEWTVCSSYF